MDGAIAAAASAHAATPTPWREWFFRLINVDEFPDSLPGARHLFDRQVADNMLSPGLWPPPTDLDDLPRWLADGQDWRAALHARLRAGLPAATPDLLLQCAPMAAIDGAWLQHVSSPLTSHAAFTSDLLRGYLRRTGTLDRVVAALRPSGLALPEPGTWAFAMQDTVAGPMFRLPTLLLALGQFPCGLLPELLGVNLFAALLGPDPVVATLAPDPADAALATTLREDAMAAIAHAPPGVAASARLRGGYAVAARLFVDHFEAILAHAAAPAPSPADRMTALLRRKAPFARGYHARKALGGRSLDAWFAPEQEMPALLQALATSPYVRPGVPERSVLLTAANAPRGVMAGIFDRDEQATIAEWIRSLPEGAATSTARPLTPPVEPDPAPAPAAVANGPVWAKLPLRELYHHLLHLEETPELLPYARNFAMLWLARAGAGLDRGARAIPFARYEHAALEAWLLNQHAAQVASYDPAAPPPLPSREILIDEAVQLCPMVLIDGAWLHRIGQVAFRATPVGALLHRIYLDEVGDGSVRENHPNVYRELMAEMGVTLPEFGTLDFALWPGFRDAAFPVPVFWLCISRFPRHFLPEILGLNLAMELSGVGGSYRAAADAMRAYGFTPSFIELHNTVDNAASGHTALALDAIKRHLDEMLERGGAEEVQRRWKRVWTGYRALVPPPGFA